MELGLLAAKDANWQESGKYLDRAVALDPVDFPQAWYADAVANYNLKKYDAAEKSARAAVKLDPQARQPAVRLSAGTGARREARLRRRGSRIDNVYKARAECSGSGAGEGSAWTTREADAADRSRRRVRAGDLRASSFLAIAASAAAQSGPAGARSCWRAAAQLIRSQPAEAVEVARAGAAARSRTSHAALPAGPRVPRHRRRSGCRRPNCARPWAEPRIPPSAHNYLGIVLFQDGRRQGRAGGVSRRCQAGSQRSQRAFQSGRGAGAHRR